MGNQKSCFVGSGSLTHYRFVTSVDPESLEHRVLDICFATATEVMEERSNKRSKRWGFRKSLRLRESLHQNQTGLEVFDKDGIAVSLLPVLTNPDDPRNLQLFHRSEEHTSELQSQFHLVCRLLLEKKKY